MYLGLVRPPLNILTENHPKYRVSRTLSLRQPFQTLERTVFETRPITCGRDNPGFFAKLTA